MIPRFQISREIFSEAVADSPVANLLRAVNGHSRPGELNFPLEAAFLEQIYRQTGIDLAGFSEQFRPALLADMQATFAARDAFIRQIGETDGSILFIRDMLRQYLDIIHAPPEHFTPRQKTPAEEALERRRVLTEVLGQTGGNLDEMERTVFRNRMRRIIAEDYLLGKEQPKLETYRLALKRAIETEVELLLQDMLHSGETIYMFPVAPDGNQGRIRILYQAPRIDLDNQLSIYELNGHPIAIDSFPDRRGVKPGKTDMVVFDIIIDQILDGQDVSKYFQSPEGLQRLWSYCMRTEGIKLLHELYGHICNGSAPWSLDKYDRIIRDPLVLLAENRMRGNTTEASFQHNGVEERNGRQCIDFISFEEYLATKILFLSLVTKSTSIQELLSYLRNEGRSIQRYSFNQGFSNQFGREKGYGGEKPQIGQHGEREIETELASRESIEREKDRPTLALIGNPEAVARVDYVAADYVGSEGYTKYDGYLETVDYVTRSEFPYLASVDRRCPVFIEPYRRIATIEVRIDNDEKTLLTLGQDYNLEYNPISGCYCIQLTEVGINRLVEGTELLGIYFTAGINTHQSPVAPIPPEIDNLPIDSEALRGVAQHLREKGLQQLADDFDFLIDHTSVLTTTEVFDILRMHLVYAYREDNLHRLPALQDDPLYYIRYTTADTGQIAVQCTQANGLGMYILVHAMGLPAELRDDFAKHVYLSKLLSSTSSDEAKATGINYMGIGHTDIRFEGILGDRIVRYQVDLTPAPPESKKDDKAAKRPRVVIDYAPKEQHDSHDILYHMRKRFYDILFPSTQAERFATNIEAVDFDSFKRNVHKMPPARRVAVILDMLASDTEGVLADPEKVRIIREVIDYMYKEDLALYRTFQSPNTIPPSKLHAYNEYFGRNHTFSAILKICTDINVFLAIRLKEEEPVS